MGILAGIIAFCVALPILAGPAFLIGIRRLRLPQGPSKKPVFELVWDNWFGQWMLKKNWAGLTTWLPFIVIISYWGADPDPDTRVHEFDHVAEGDRDLCFLVTWAKYAWGLRKGYTGDPLEVEAYAVEAEAEKNGLPDWARPSDSGH